MTPTGKIARLPGSIREELNRRLYNGELGPQLLAWLNNLPETQRILAAQFNARPINHVNLVAWRAGGYQVWLARQEALLQACEMPPEAKALSDAAEGKLTGHLTTLLAARYASALVDWDGEVTGEFRRKLRILGGLCRNVVQLRRGDLTAARTNLDHERLEWQREETLNVPLPRERGENSPKHSRIEPQNPASPDAASPSPPSDGGEGRGEEVPKVQGNISHPVHGEAGCKPGEGPKGKSNVR